MKYENTTLRDALQERFGAMALEAPTGRPPRAWTQEEKDAFKKAVEEIVELERQASAGEP